jgi:hypothetical protein
MKWKVYIFCKRYFLRNILIIFILVCTFFTNANAQDVSGIAGAFADIGYGARPIGMGGAYVALASDPYAVLWNPACLPYVRGWQVSTMYTEQFGLIPYGLVTAAKDIDLNQGVGIAALTSGDEILRESSLYVAYGRRLQSLGPAFKNFAFGATVKFRISSFGNNPDGGELRSRGNASGYGLDLGLRWKFAHKWTLGLFLRDAVNQVNYNNETRGETYGESVPTALLLGTAFMARANVVFALDFDKALYEDLNDKILMGAEWMLFNTIFLRGGWAQTLNTEPNRKINFGFGIQYFRRDFGVRFDFAYQLHFLANTPRVTVSCWF